MLNAEATWTKAFRNARHNVMLEYESKTPDDDAKLYFGKARFEIDAVGRQ